MMSAISVRLPNSLHEAVRLLVKKERSSINQFITLAIAEKLAALMTEEYLEARAERGDKAKFARAMSKVAEVEPEEHDMLYMSAAVITPEDLAREFGMSARKIRRILRRYGHGVGRGNRYAWTEGSDALELVRQQIRAEI